MKKLPSLACALVSSSAMAFFGRNAYDGFDHLTVTCLKAGATEADFAHADQAPFMIEMTSGYANPDDCRSFAIAHSMKVRENGFSGYEGAASRTRGGGSPSARTATFAYATMGAAGVTLNLTLTKDKYNEIQGVTGSFAGFGGTVALSCRDTTLGFDLKALCD